MSRWLFFCAFVVTGFTLVFCRFSELALLPKKNMTVMHPGHDTRHGLNRAQAEGIMSAMAEVIDESIRNMTSNMVTKADHEKVRISSLCICTYHRRRKQTWWGFHK